MMGALTLAPEAAADLRAAIHPETVLPLGDAIHAGYQPLNVADAIHCAHCWLAGETREEVREQIKVEITRLIDQLEEAALCLG
jgi:hypothetical protein